MLLTLLLGFMRFIITLLLYTKSENNATLFHTNMQIICADNHIFIFRQYILESYAVQI